MAIGHQQLALPRSGSRARLNTSPRGGAPGNPPLGVQFVAAGEEVGELSLRAGRPKMEALNVVANIAIGSRAKRQLCCLQSSG